MLEIDSNSNEFQDILDGNVNHVTCDEPVTALTSDGDYMRIVCTNSGRTTQVKIQCFVATHDGQMAIVFKTPTRIEFNGASYPIGKPVSDEVSYRRQDGTTLLRSEMISSVDPLLPMNVVDDSGMMRERIFVYAMSGGKFQYKGYPYELFLKVEDATIPQESNSRTVCGKCYILKEYQEQIDRPSWRKVAKMAWTLLSRKVW